MKLRYRIKLASDNMMIHGKQMLCTIILCVLVLLTCSTLFFLTYITNHFRKDINNALNGNISQLGYITIDSYSENSNISAEAFIEEIKELDEIQAVGNFEYYASSYENLSFLSQIQTGHMQMYDENTQSEASFVEIIEMDMDSWDMFSFSLYQGDYPNNLKNTETKNIEYMYLGYEYKDLVDVGTIIEGKGEDESTYIVEGFFKKGESIISPYAYAIDKFNLYSTLSLDYAVVIIKDTNKLIGSGIYFMVSDEFDYDEGYLAVGNLGEGISGEIYSMDKILRTEEKSVKNINKYLLQIILVAGITLCIVFTCIQTMNIIDRKYEYGILCANGLTMRDIIFIIIIENIIKIVIALIIAFPLSYYMANLLYEAENTAKNVIFCGVLCGVMPYISLVAIIIAIISSILPIFIINNQTPDMLIGDKHI